MLTAGLGRVSPTTTHTLDVSATTPGFGDLLGVSADAGPTDLYDASYAYDDRGRIDTWTESLQGGASVTRKFAYDAAGRLVTVHDISGGLPGTLLEEYQYDGNGNRQKAVSTYPGAVPLSAELGVNLGCPDATGTAANDEDQLCQYGDYTYSYNLRGQLQSKSDGSVTSSYTYDGLGRLKRVTEPGMDIHYVHDALGRRIGKIRDGNLEKGWLYTDALNPIAQLDGSGAIEATFVYGTRAHVPDAMVMTNGTVYRLITDHLGSVRLVVNAQTGAVAQRIDYDAFGRVLQDTSPGFQPFGFAGGLYDDDTGLVRFGARDYEAYAGRWTAKDPILFDGGDPNLYAYATNDALNYIDSNGYALDVFVDLGFIGYDLAQIWLDNIIGCKGNLQENLTALGLDVVGAVLPFATGLGRGYKLALNPPINITQKGLEHTLQRHTINGLEAFAGKSKFNKGENVTDLIRSSTQQPAVRQANGNYARTFDAGRNVGVDHATGAQTSTMTVITRPNGDLVTAFPGSP